MAAGHPCRLCGEFIFDDLADVKNIRAEWHEHRIAFLDWPSGTVLGAVHPRCWELLDGLIIAMIRLAHYPELNKALTKP